MSQEPWPWGARWPKERLPVGPEYSHGRQKLTGGLAVGTGVTGADWHRVVEVNFPYPVAGRLTFASDTLPFETQIRSTGSLGGPTYAQVWAVSPVNVEVTGDTIIAEVRAVAGTRMACTFGLEAR